MGKSLDVVNGFLATMSEGPAAGEKLAAWLAEDFHFDGPMLSAKTRDEFLQGMAGMGPMTPRFTMLQQVEHGDAVCSVYEFRKTDGAAPVLMAEWSTVRGQQLSAQRLIYDAAQMQAAMAG